ncbi:hypothetical protein N665_1839s0001 [Sinapis alba]|nr:hypothetical protein N665_1839s0001 [Sinapis alba]
MESPKKIPHEIGGVKRRDALRFGLNGVKSDIVGSHPLESSYEYDDHWAYLRDCTSVEDGPIPSSMLGLEVYTGAIDNFGFEDYLNDPRDSETFKPVDFHHGMEVRLGMSKGPVAPSFM